MTKLRSSHRLSGHTAPQIVITSVASIGNRDPNRVFAYPQKVQVTQLKFLIQFQTKGGESECRYGLFDFEYDHQCQGTTDTSKKQKLFLMSW